jgi:hypothetical protein
MVTAPSSSICDVSHSGAPVAGDLASWPGMSPGGCASSLRITGIRRITGIPYPGLRNHFLLGAGDTADWISFDNNETERAIRMSKLRIKVSGCMRSMAGAGEFCAIRSYLATAARHDISALDALTQAFQGNPWIPETG